MKHSTFILTLILLGSLIAFGQTNQKRTVSSTSKNETKIENNIANKWSKRLQELSFVRQLDRNKIKSSSVDLSSIFVYSKNSDNEYISNFIGALGRNYQRVDLLFLNSKHKGQQTYTIQMLLKKENNIDTLNGEMRLNKAFEIVDNIENIFIYSFEYKLFSSDKLTCLEGINSISFSLKNNTPKNYWYEDGSFNEYVRTFVGSYSNQKTGEKTNCVFAVKPAGLYNYLPFCKGLYFVNKNENPDFYYINDKYKQFGWKDYEYQNPKADKWWVNNKQNDSKTLEQIQGYWFHDKDSLASISVNNSQWIFNYQNHNCDLNDIYTIILTDKLPEFVKALENSEFIILSNNTDTLQYEILGLTDTTFSLMHFPSGKIHLYRRKQ